MQTDINLYRYCGDDPVSNVDPLGLRKVRLPYEIGRFWNNYFELDVPDGAVVVHHQDGSWEILFPGGNRSIYFAPPAGGYSAVEVSTDSKGIVTVNLNKNCTLVVLMADGNATTPHQFNFVGTKPGCSAAVFNGCHSPITNKLIPPANLIPGACPKDKELNIGGLYEDKTDSNNWNYWYRNIQKGAKNKANSICTNKDCGCKEVTVYYERVKNGPGSTRMPKSHTEKIPCK